MLPTELLLAGRFEADQVADAVETIERHGGAVLVNRDELTFERPRAAGATGWISRSRR